MPYDPELICRCCGQITKALKDMQAMKLIEWFLLYTNLDENQYCSNYHKICGQCEQTLLKAHQFREDCLMAEQLFVAEKSNLPTVVDEVKNEGEPDAEMDSPMSANPENVLRKTKLPPKTRKKDCKPRKIAPVKKTSDLIKTKLEYLCEFCGSKFHKKDNYKKHLDSHLTERNFSCELCQNKFKSRRHLQGHMIYHDDPKLECDLCGKKSYTASALTQHKLTHVEMKGSLKYACTLCDKKYSLPVHLKHHMNAHSNTRPYQCVECSKSFRRSGALNNHIRKEHMQSQQQCVECGFVCKRRESLKLHTLFKHRSARLICNVCSQEFRSMKSISLHLNKTHNINFNQSIHIVLPTNEKVIRPHKILHSTSNISRDQLQPDIESHQEITMECLDTNVIYEEIVIDPSCQNINEIMKSLKE